MNDNKYQDFLTKLQTADESERDWLVMKFSLQNLTDVLQQAVWAAAIPHWFDHAFLNAVLGFELKDSDFQALTELSFIESFPERGFNVHERSRNLLLNYLWKNKKTRFQKLSKHAATYCKKQDQDVTHWRIETLYHGLLAGFKNAKDDFVAQASSWFDTLQYEKLENLTQTILDAVNIRLVTDEIAAWSALFQVKLDLMYSRYSSAQDLLQHALKQKTNKLLTILCIKTLGDIHHYHLSNQIQARDYYQQALLGSQQLKDRMLEASSIQAIGNVNYALAEYEVAKNYYKKALQFFQNSPYGLNEANCILGLGDVHFQLGEYKQALDYYQQALLINQGTKAYLNIANCIGRLGLVYGAQQQIALAITKAKEAAELYEKFGNQSLKAACFDEIARIYQHEKQYEQALAAYNQAIEISPNVESYQNRAKLYMEIENYEKAEADVRHAETRGKNPAYTLLGNAELVLWQQLPAQAVEFSQQALAQRPADGNFRAFFALTLLANGQTEQANAEMQQALTAIYQPHDFADLLENIDKLIRIYGNRAEFATMRELIATSRKQPNEE